MVSPFVNGLTVCIGPFFHVFFFHGFFPFSLVRVVDLGVSPAQIIDDWGFHDIGFRSPEMQTPTLDRFHQQGATARDGFSPEGDESRCLQWLS